MKLLDGKRSWSLASAAVAGVFVLAHASGVVVVVVITR